MDKQLNESLLDLAKAKSELNIRLDKISMKINALEEQLQGCPSMNVERKINDVGFLRWENKRLRFQGRFVNPGPLENRPLIECPACIRLMCDAELTAFVQQYACALRGK